MHLAANYTVWFTLYHIWSDIPWLIQNGTSVDWAYMTHKIKYFYANMSTTFKPVGRRFACTFARGELATEIFGIPGTPLLVNQSFGLANSVDSLFGAFGADEVLGLMPKRKSKNGPPTYLWSVRDLLPQPIVSLWFEKQRYTWVDNKAAITFGGLDTQHCDSKWLYVPRDESADEGKWAVRIARVVVETANGSIEIPGTQGNQAEIVEGFQSILGPGKITSKIAALVGAEYDGGSRTGYYIPCEKMHASRPIVRFVFNDELSITVTPEDYSCQFAESDVCEFAFGNYLGSYPNWRLGVRFLNQNCVAYDFGQQKIAFAPHKLAQK